MTVDFGDGDKIPVPPVSKFIVPSLRFWIVEGMEWILDIEKLKRANKQKDVKQ